MGSILIYDGGLAYRSVMTNHGGGLIMFGGSLVWHILQAKHSEAVIHPSKVVVWGE